MSYNYDWLTEPDWETEDACELCDEPAMPYDANTDFPWCPEHAMQMWSGCGSEDFEIHPESEHEWEHRRAERKMLHGEDLCHAWTSMCCERGTPRVKKDELDSPDILHLSTVLCAHHAQERFTGFEQFITREEWMIECTPGYLTDDDDELDD